MHSKEFKEKVITFAKNNPDVNNSAISKMFNISYYAVRSWVNGSSYIKKNPDKISITSEDYVVWFLEKLKNDFEFSKAYYYLLGQYLGDGWIFPTHNKRTFCLRIAAADTYPNIKLEIISAMNTIFPNNKVTHVKVVGCETICVHNNSIPLIFPHCGTGKKHDRKIELVDWQKDNIQYLPLLRGLFHSDGCRYLRYKSATGNINLDISNYAYNFTNASLDIAKVYMMWLDNLDVKYTLSEKAPRKEHYKKIYSVNSYTKSEVVKLYHLIGEKT